jgi:hypothetical protein
MTRSRRLAWAVLALTTTTVLGPLVLTACGSSSPPTASPTAPARDATSTTDRRSFPPAPPVDPAIGVSAFPVTPLVSPQRSTFEGFTVESYIPPRPSGVVYLFHGSGGSADFVTRIETIDVINRFVRDGYGYVASESTNRATKQWDIDDATPSSNPDLARMAALRQHIIDTTAVDGSTPTFGIGMSNGSAFVALWASALTKAGTKIDAIGMYMAGMTQATRSLGGVPAPTFMVVGQNDTRTVPAKEQADLVAIGRAGVPTELHIVRPRPVTYGRYLRIPGVDRATADAIVAAYVKAGVVTAAGTLAVTLPRITNNDPAPLFPGVALPASLTPAQQRDVDGQTLDTIAEHQFNAEFAAQNLRFFDAHRAPT